MGKVATVVINGVQREVGYTVITEDGKFLAARIDTKSLENISRAELYELIRAVDTIAMEEFYEEQAEPNTPF